MSKDKEDMVIEGMAEGAGALVVEAGKTVVHEAILAGIRKVISGFREKRFNIFLQALVDQGVTEKEVEDFLKDETKAALLEKVADAVTKSGTKISRLALARILGANIKETGRYKTYEVGRAVEALQDLDDVDALILISWVEISRNRYSHVSKGLAIRPLAQRVTLPIVWSDFEQNKDFVPKAVGNEHELFDVMDRLVRRGLFALMVGLTDYENGRVQIGEFGLKVKEDLALAADACGYTVPQSKH